MSLYHAMAWWHARDITMADYRRFENGYRSATDYCSADHRYRSCGPLAFMVAVVIVGLTVLAMNHSLAVVIERIVALATGA